MRSSLLHLGIALIICVTAGVGYWFEYTTIAAKSTAVAALQDQIDAKTAAVSRMTTTRAALAEISGDESIVQSYFVSETGVVAFIDSLQARGQTLGATVSVLSVSTDSAGTQPMFDFSLSIKGTFDAVLRTVGAIEYAPYAISISSVSVDQDAKNSWIANVKLLVGSVAAKAATNTP
ncbi:hypothetical protein KGQ72_00930 [Patescibacteria group bacterium]|nr:hypothetical protein [Patescibacteria group bacterium]